MIKAVYKVIDPVFIDIYLSGVQVNPALFNYKKVL
jgi:hypothetical protein